VGSPGKGNTYTVSLAPAVLGNRKSKVGLVTMNPGRAGFSFPFLSEGVVSASALSSGTSSAGGSRVKLHDIVITKLFDKTSVRLAQALASGKGFSIVKIELGNGKILETITLSNALIASLQVSGPAHEGLPTESLTLSFTKEVIAFKK
jgi:type VI protein secretion system component Hcp